MRWCCPRGKCRAKDSKSASRFVCLASHVHSNCTILTLPPCSSYIADAWPPPTTARIPLSCVDSRRFTIPSPFFTASESSASARLPSSVPHTSSCVRAVVVAIQHTTRHKSVSTCVNDCPRVQLPLFHLYLLTPTFPASVSSSSSDSGDSGNSSGDDSSGDEESTSGPRSVSGALDPVACSRSVVLTSGDKAQRM